MSCESARNGLDGAPPRLTLTPLQGPERPPIVIEAGEAVVIGRSEECDVQLVDSRVSRRQAEIASGSEGWTVTDLDSRYGTHLHTIRLEPGEAMALEHLALLHMGPWTFQVLIGADGPGGAGHEIHTNPALLARIRENRSSVRDLSWEEFDERYRPVIAGFARNRGLRGADVDDVVNETISSLVRALKGFDYDRKRGRFRGYLKKATISAIRRVLAKSREPDGVLDVDEISAATVGNAWELEWTRDVLRRAMEAVRTQVEPRTWEAFDLYGRQGVPGPEVARELGTTFDNVRAAKTNVLRRLRVELQRINQEET